jgi:hypothetical protein
MFFIQHNYLGWHKNFLKGTKNLLHDDLLKMMIVNFEIH